MKIAILGGTGKEGSGLAYRWAAAGHEVIIGSRTAEKGEAAEPKPAPSPSGGTSPEPPAPKEPAPPTTSKPARQLVIDTVVLKIGKVEYRNYKKEGEPPKISTQELNIDMTLKDVRGLGSVSRQIAAQVLMRTGLQDIIDKVATEENKKGISETLEKATKAFGELFKKQKSQ